MIKVDTALCQKCGICLSSFNGYCMSENNGIPIIEVDICNQCQKCIAICPHQALSFNGIPPTKIIDATVISYDDLMRFFSFRRSTKDFKNQSIPHTIIEQIVSSAKFAPNQNKNIEILIIDNLSIIQEIDSLALKFFRRLYSILFALTPFTMIIGLFTKSLKSIKKKMERDLFYKKHIVKRNTNALLIAIGNSKVPVTEMSAQYLLSTMIYAATSLGIGSTLMDSLKIGINSNKYLKGKLGISIDNKVLGVLALGYSNERIINIPNGYEITRYWNYVVRCELDAFSIHPGSAPVAHA